jgi:hypothetical protein
MFGVSTTDDFTNRVSGYVQVSAYLFDTPFLYKIIPPNFCYRFHYQHPPDLHEKFHGRCISEGGHFSTLIFLKWGHYCTLNNNLWYSAVMIPAGAAATRSIKNAMDVDA